MVVRAKKSPPPGRSRPVWITATGVESRPDKRRNGGGTMASASGTAEAPTIRSTIPARIDRLPWSRFHTRLVIALGVAWVLYGLEVMIASNVGPDLALKNTRSMPPGSDADIAWWYLIGEVIGALFFGRLSDKLGRKNLFMVTLGVYLVGSGLTAATPKGGYS